MTIGRDIIGNLAKQFGYSKELVREALATNQIDPLTASLIGSRIDKLQQTRQEAGARTTVLEDVLAPTPEEAMSRGIAAAPQQAPSALAALPSNLPVEGMAAGGIVAFAEGGNTEEEDEEEELQAMERSGLAQLMGRISGGFAGVIPRGVAIPKSYEAALAEKGQTPASARKLMIEGPKKGDYVMPPLDSQRPSGEGIMQKRGGHKYEDVVVKEAERLGVDPNLALHVLYKETGNLKNPETARSKAGALGVMQLMPRTAKELGVDPLNPEENIRGGVTYLKKMLDQFNDPTLALAAYNAGPGRVNQVLRSGQGITALPRETQNYVRMADGGIVAFDDGGLSMVSPEFGGGEQPISAVPKPRTMDELFKEYPGLEGNVGRLQLDDYLSGRAIPPESAKPPKPKPAPTTAPAATPAPEITQEQIDKLIGGEKPGPGQEDSIMKKYMSLLEGREKSAADQKKQDAYMALLSAGLGIMGGTSPFAAVNIGQGAQAGVATQLAARKAQIADERATLAGYGSAAAAQEAAKERQAKAAQAREGKVAGLIANREKQLETLALNTITKIGLNIDTAEGQAALAKEIQRLKGSDQLLPRLYQEYGLPPIQVAAPAKPLTKDELLAQRKAEKDRLGIK